MKISVFQFGTGIELVDIQMPEYRLSFVVNWESMEFLPVFCMNGEDRVDDPDPRIPQDIVDVAIANTMEE